MVLPDLKQIESRPGHYWSMDGLSELVMGMVWLIWGGLILIGNHWISGSWALIPFWTATPLLLVLLGLRMNWIISKLKERVSFPRAGYVELRRPGRVHWFVSALLALIALAAMLILIVTDRTGGLEVIVSPGVGLAMAAIFAFLAVGLRAGRYLLLSGVALAFGLAVHGWKLGYDGLNWTIVGMGIVSSAMGAWRLRRFLRANPRPEVAES